MDKIIKNKRNLELVNSYSLGYKTSATSNLCKLMHAIINYSISICPSESGKSGKEEEKLQKFEYLPNEKSFSDEIKKVFHSF